MMGCRYKALLAQREGSDCFVDGEAQTVEHLQKAKEVQCNTTSTEEIGVQVRGPQCMLLSSNNWP